MKIIIEPVMLPGRTRKKALYAAKIVDEQGHTLWRGKGRNSQGQAQTDAEKALARLEEKALARLEKKAK